ncbi:Uncharacterised protein [[Eubacterium] infirmum]|nr:Uncharacterised protein [[Eubacterium] infirmum]
MSTKVICLGDSLTFGNVGYSYIKLLEKQSFNQYINRE